MTVSFSRQRGLSIAEVIATVSRTTGIPVHELMSRTSRRAVAWPRQVAMVLSQELTAAPLSMVGRVFRRNHSTVMYARRRLRNRCAIDADYAAEVAHLRAEIEAARTFGPPTREQMFIRLMAPMTTIKLAPPLRRIRHPKVPHA